MKLSLLFFCCFLAVASLSFGGVAVSLSVGDFGMLEGHGQWVASAQFGQVWHPAVAPDWRPFTYGHWVMTDEGWTWASDEPYGWVVYHYGNWTFDPALGWVWVPGYDYSPARVNWINYGSYVGWAPAPPPGVVVPDPWAPARVHYWNVVETRYLDTPNVARVVVHAPARPVHVTEVVRVAPTVQVFEKASARKVEVVHVQTKNVTYGKHEFRQNQVGNAHQESAQAESKQKEKDKGKNKEKNKNKPH